MTTKTVIRGLQRQANLIEDLIQYESMENMLERTLENLRRERVRMYMTAWEDLEAAIIRKATHLINRRGDVWDIR